jgi:transposase-like protein
VERKRKQRYSKEFKTQAIERMNTCDNISRLSRELGVARHLLYHWRDRWLQGQPRPGLFREVCLRKQILRLKRMLAKRAVADEEPSFRGRGPRGSEKS